MSDGQDVFNLHGHNQIMSDCVQSAQGRLQPRVITLDS